MSWWKVVYLCWIVLFLRVQLCFAAIIGRKVEPWFIFSKFIRYCWFDDSCSVFSEGFAGLYHTKITQDCCTIKSDNKLTKDVVIWFSFHFCFFDRNFLADVFNFWCSSCMSTVGLQVDTRPRCSGRVILFKLFLFSSTTLIFIKCQKRCQMIFHLYSWLQIKFEMSTNIFADFLFYCRLVEKG